MTTEAVRSNLFSPSLEGYCCFRAPHGDCLRLVILTLFGFFLCPILHPFPPFHRYESHLNSLATKPSHLLLKDTIRDDIQENHQTLRNKSHKTRTTSQKTQKKKSLEKLRKIK
jgi:hypothetical protein